MMVLPLYVDPTELCMRLTIRLFINNRDGCRTIFILLFIILLSFFFVRAYRIIELKKKRINDWSRYDRHDRDNATFDESPR